MQEEHYERPLVQGFPEDEVDLGEAGFASPVLQCILRTLIRISVVLRSTLDFRLHFLLHCPAECILARELEVFRGSVHLCPLHICHNNKYIIAAMVVHAPQEHKFGELESDVSPDNSHILSRYAPPRIPLASR
jgi:hypothetical protein